MPIPEEHLRFIDDSQKAHEQRIRSLRIQIQQLEDEITVHQTLLDLMRNPALTASLSELMDSPITSSVASDAITFFREKGVVFPARTKIHMTPIDERGVMTVKGVFVQGNIWYTATWHSVDGFSVTPTSPEDIDLEDRG